MIKIYDDPKDKLANYESNTIDNRRAMVHVEEQREIIDKPKCLYILHRLWGISLERIHDMTAIPVEKLKSLLTDVDDHYEVSRDEQCYVAALVSLPDKELAEYLDEITSHIKSYRTANGFKHSLRSRIKYQIRKQQAERFMELLSDERKKELRIENK